MVLVLDRNLSKEISQVAWFVGELIWGWAKARNKISQEGYVRMNSFRRDGWK